MVKKTTDAKSQKSRSTPGRIEPSGRDGKSETHRIEWIFGFCAALVLLTIITFLGLETFSRTGGKPELALLVVEERETGLGKEIVIEVRNDGQATAASVEIAGSSDNQVWQQVTLDYAPAQSRRKVTLVFPSGVHSDSVRLEIVGYLEP